MPKIFADTPQDLLDILILWASDAHIDALKKACAPHLSRDTAAIWSARAANAHGLKTFLASLTIEPKPSTVLVTPAPQSEPTS